MPSPLAGFAASAANIETETSRLVTAHPGLRGAAEKLPYGSEQAGIGGGIGTRGLADWGLIDVDDLIDFFETGDPFVSAGAPVELLQMANGGPVQSFDDQGGLSGAGNAGDTGECSQRKPHFDVF